MAASKRNPEIVKGVGKFNRSQMYKRRGLWAIKAKNGGKFPVHPKQVKEEAKKIKAPRFYPADDVAKPMKKNIIRNAPKLRASITPGTVLILLGGNFKGKRVVFLKQLTSGLLLVTGPYKVNGVPLRRVNQNFAIATSTKLDVSTVDVAKFDDSYFVTAKEKETKGEEEFFEGEEEKKKEIPEEKKEDQKAIDGILLPLIDAVPELKEYLTARFTLKSADKPHEMVF